MEYIPLIRVKRRKIGNNISEEKIRETQLKGYKIYILDEDGIRKDKPNVSLYQRLSRYQEIWVDAGPRNEGDLVDILIAGASMVTLRRENWYNLDINELRELTENPLYLYVEVSRTIEKQLLSQYDGIVVFTPIEKLREDFTLEGILKELCRKIDTYAYERNPTYIRSWENIGVKGLIVDIEEIERFTEL
ncbi:MAG TPA: hypothetical protein ENG62_02430 [Thermoplasmatales archaeon]|nr:hypothetical protein [Thermoplasmatales archaeon]